MEYSGVLTLTNSLAGGGRDFGAISTERIQMNCKYLDNIYLKQTVDLQLLFLSSNPHNRRLSSRNAKCTGKYFSAKFRQMRCLWKMFTRKPTLCVDHAQVSCQDCILCRHASFKQYCKLQIRWNAE